LHKETVPFPPLSAEEEQEIKDKLGIEPTADLEATVRSTLRKIKQVEIEEQPTRDEEYEEIGTVRIKGMPDGDKFGTIRRKKKQEEEEEDWTGTVRIYSDPQAFFNDDRATSEDKTDDTDTTDDQYGTMRIRHDSSDEDEEVDKKEEKTDKKNNSRPKRKPFSKRVKKNEPQFVYRPPEEWELNIIAIERGEWSEHMSEEAFRKYKKERPKLKDCAFLVEEEEQVANPIAAFAGKVEAGTARRSSGTVLGAQRMKDHTEDNNNNDKKVALTNSNGASVDPVQGQRAFAAMKKAGAAVNIKKK
jgi:hypothetical protein